jgi:hypothetical protein
LFHILYLQPKYVPMKKLYILFLFSALYLNSYGQQLTSQDEELNVSGPPTATLSGHATIVNIGSQIYDLLCGISSSTMTPGHSKYFCFGDYCYDTTTTLSPLVTPVDVDGTALLSAYCVPNNIEGTSVVSYKIYDANGNTDTVSLTFTYNLATGIREHQIETPTLSLVGPNPAHNLTAVKYSFAASKNARLVIQNLLGVSIKEIQLRDNHNTLILPVSEFKNGVYIYTLMIDGKPAASKKLIVAHK